jgi:thioredoxin reductase (NADPH)
MYDTIIIGAGAAGASAAIYATRYNLKTLLLGGLMPGGLITEALEIENYPGYLSISGQQLAQNFIDQAVALGAEYQVEVVEDLTKINNGNNKYFEVKTYDKTYEAKSVILATGTHHKKLNVKGEDTFAGIGVSYCSTCDAPFFKNKEVIVVGGGNSAVEGAQDVSVHASIVYLAYRSELKAAPIYISELRKKENIIELPNTSIKEIKGNAFVESVVLDRDYKGTNELKVQGVFVQIGYQPKNELAQKIGLELSQYGYVKVDAGMATSLKGIFCAGDLNNASNMLHQQVTSAAEGAIAAQSAYRYVNGMDHLVPNN